MPLSVSELKSHVILPNAFDGFLLVLILDPEDGGDTFLLNVWLSRNYTAL
jgi:hypothetical protein